MNEIKFRAWDKVDGMKHFDLDDLYYRRLTIDHGVYDVPIMQYTGVKTCEGEELFKSDIVKFVYEDKFVHGLILWDEGYCGFIIDIIGTPHGYEIGQMVVDDEEWTIIGNIYQNPELLK